MSQLTFFEESPKVKKKSSSKTDKSTTFQDNLSLPVHRWFRYSAGFSADWVKSVLKTNKLTSKHLVLDPFGGSGTTPLECQFNGINAIGLDPHPFVSRVAEAKGQWNTDAKKFKKAVADLIARADEIKADTTGYVELIHSCYDADSLIALDKLRRAVDEVGQKSATGKLLWLVLAAIIRPTSKAGTAQWQYVLPKKSKRKVLDPMEAFQMTAQNFITDMEFRQINSLDGGSCKLIKSDARTCEGVEDNSVDFVITSPPYPNNFDYADATRLEMSFFQEIQGWGDLQEKVRKHLVRACSQHVPPKSIDAESILASPEVACIRGELTEVYNKLSTVRLEKGGKKTYNNMIVCYYHDMARTWIALRRVCKQGARVCFVIGDSAPYGVYAPAVDWMGRLAVAAGFKSWTFEKTRDRNIKWKNRKHTVPLQEGRLWVKG
jgi:hypothetical protein